MGVYRRCVLGRIFFFGCKKSNEKKDRGEAPAFSFLLISNRRSLFDDYFFAFYSLINLYVFEEPLLSMMLTT